MSVHKAANDAADKDKEGTLVDAFADQRSLLASPVWCPRQTDAYDIIERLKDTPGVDRIEQMYRVDTGRTLKLPGLAEPIEIKDWRKKTFLLRGVENGKRRWIAVDPFNE